MDLDIFPRTWYPSLDVFPASLISFSSTSWQSMLSLTLVDETRTWSCRERRGRTEDFTGSFFVVGLVFIVVSSVSVR